MCYLESDSSLTLSWDEFDAIVRDELNVSRGELPKHKLQAVWLTFDVDDSGCAHVLARAPRRRSRRRSSFPLARRRRLITAGEFAEFMRRGKIARQTAPTEVRTPLARDCRTS
jgi:hypothetical protein